MKSKLKILIWLFIVNINFLIPQLAISTNFTSDTSYQVCFTPGENCTAMIVDAINDAKKSIYVQAYSFTSAPIAAALVAAKHRHLDVKIILDKSQIKNNKYSSSKFLMNNNIPTWIDYRPAIAHNKIILIDDKIVITGSFNFTKAAQMRNAENLLIIKNSDLVNKYYINWRKRLELSYDGQKYLKLKNIKYA